MGKKKDIQVVIDGKEYWMSYGELAQSNSILLEALIAELSKQGVIDPKELGKSIQKIRESRLKKN
ncbi:MAG: hypothetical protein ACLFSQ_06460 [Candidatus Zixiibacteriota bacterium]